MNGIFKIDGRDDYEQQAMVYGSKDVLQAVVLYIVVLVNYLLTGIISAQQSTHLTEAKNFCITGISSLINIGIVFLFCLISKQKLDTVGFSKKYADKSFLLGLIPFSIILITYGVIPLISGATIKKNIIVFIMRTIYFLIFIALEEELVFRGYIGTRFYGFFTNKRLSIVIVGIMFSFMHIPFRMVTSHMSLNECILSNQSLLFTSFIWHLVLQWLYKKYNSIVGPTILHFIIDYIQWIIVY